MKTRKAATKDARKEKYCQARADGLSQRKAYQASHPGTKAKPEAQDAIASRLERDVKIKQRIDELKRRAAAGLILSRDEIAADLATMASDDSRPDYIRLKAYDQLSRVVGAYDDHAQVDVRAVVLTAEDKASALKAFLQSMRD